MDFLITVTIVCGLLLPIVFSLIGATERRGGVGFIVGLMLFVKVFGFIWFVVVVVHFIGKYW